MSDSPRHGLNLNSLAEFSIKTKVEIESTLEKQKFWISVVFNKILFVSSQTRETFWINIRKSASIHVLQYNRKNEG